MEQQIRFCTTDDGVRLAYAQTGKGPPLVKVSNWLSHLERDWGSPVWRHWLAELSRDHTFIRYDERGCGLSDWDVPELSFEAWVRDLETVVNAVGVERFPLLGISQGAAIAIAYTVRHPERVSHLVLYGGYARGVLKRKLTHQQREEAQTMGQAGRVGVGQGEPGLSAVLHYAVHSRRYSGAASMVQRTRTRIHVAAERRALLARVPPDRCHPTRDPCVLSYLGYAPHP
jgi:pimeloyl-ACP methyl ester carboxylesterase